MATMLVFITTDACISPKMLNFALKTDIQNTFNMLSVDGDTSTNDMVTVLANGMAGTEEINDFGEDFDAFMKALNSVNVYLSRQIVGDGEGATKLLECVVTGAKTLEDAKNNFVEMTDNTEQNRSIIAIITKSSFRRTTSQLSNATVLRLNPSGFRRKNASAPVKTFRNSAKLPT